MSQFKVSSDLFIGSQELNRLIKSLDDDGFRKLFLKNAMSFGLFNNSIGGNFLNGQIQQGTNIGSIKGNELFAIDSNGQIIYKAAFDNFSLTNDSNWYWIKIAHTYSNNESYLVNVDKSGNLTAPNSDGNFTSILRGQPNNQSKISFTNATLNTSEYNVVEVIDDNNVILAGDFLAESNLTIAVVGSFTPDIVVPGASKYPFNYDSCTMSVVLETVLDTPPTLIADQEFVIARVKRTGGSVIIQDKRTSIYKDRGSYKIDELPSVSNPLIGVEQIVFDNRYSTKEKNLVYVGFGFRSSNWTINSSTNTVTLLGGNGGKYKTTADFVNGDFDGWRLYLKNGKHRIIKQSSISALQINLVLDQLDADDFSDTTQEIHIAPNAEEIELIFTPVTAGTTQQRMVFSIDQGLVKIPLNVYAKISCQYTFTYRYKNFRSFTQETVVPNDAVGYYIETDFSTDGILTGSAKQTVTSGVITLLESVASYDNQIGSLSTGDLFGFELVPLDNAVNVVDFIVGVRKQNVYITQDTDPEDSASPSAFVFSQNQYINLRTDLPALLRGGNSFFVQFGGDYVPSGFKLQIVQDYVSPVNPGIIIYTFTSDDFAIINDFNLFFRFIYDNINEGWIVNRFVADNSESLAAEKAARIAADALKADKAQAAWTNYTLLNGWTNAGSFNTPGFRITDTNRLESKGQVNATGSLIFANITTSGLVTGTSVRMVVANLTTHAYTELLFLATTSSNIQVEGQSGVNSGDVLDINVSFPLGALT